MKTGESPSHTIYASARGLGKLANILANKGKIDDQKRILSEKGWELMH
jgi:hypothetical protein